MRKVVVVDQRDNDTKDPRGLARYAGPDEWLLIAALMLLTAGLWSRIGSLALVAPAVVLLWVCLPTRQPLMVFRPEPPAKREKS